MASNESWDDMVRKKLEGYQPDYRSGSWDALQQRMNEESPEDAALDHLVAQSLNRYRPRYESSSWAVLAARLEREAHHRQSVICYKIVEVSLAFTLLLLLWRFFPVEVSAPAPATDASAPVAGQLSPPPVVADASSLTTAAADEASAKAVPTIDSEDRQARATARLRDLQLSPLAVPAQTDGAEGLLTLPSQAQPPAAMPVESQPLQPIANRSLAVEMPAIISPTQSTHFRVGFVASFVDVNLVTSSPTTLAARVDIPATWQFARGYSSGLTFSAMRGKWEFETGLSYAARMYSPALDVFLSEKRYPFLKRYREYSRFEINTLSLPLNIYRTMAQQGRWRTYLGLGSAANVVVQANYYPAEEESIFNTPGTGGATPKEDVYTRFNPGLLENGGLIRENTTIYLIGSFGVERYFNDGSSLFFQPSYYHTVFRLNGRGLGPYGDQIQSLQLNMGMKLKF